MSSEKYRKKYMAICAVCGEEKPLEEMADGGICVKCKIQAKGVLAWYT